ncbi:hypothetical protein MMC06_005451 [Schaereria dolodes]|nr:hypothetical protein [Schaereria dolodes]
MAWNPLPGLWVPPSLSNAGPSVPDMPPSLAPGARVGDINVGTAPFDIQVFQQDGVICGAVSTAASDCDELYAQIEQDPAHFNFAHSGVQEFGGSFEAIEGSFSRGKCEVAYVYDFSTDGSNPPDGNVLWEWMEPLWDDVKTECLNNGRFGAVVRPRTAGTGYNVFSISETRVNQNSEIQPADTDPESQAGDTDLENQADEAESLIPFNVESSDTNTRIVRMLRRRSERSPCSWLCNMKDGLNKENCLGLLSTIEHLASDYIAWQLLRAQERLKYPQYQYQIGVTIATIMKRGINVVQTWDDACEVFKLFAEEMNRDEAEKACILARWTATEGLFSALEGALLIAAGATNCDHIGTNIAGVGIIFDGALGLSSGLIDMVVGFCHWNAKQSTSPSAIDAPTGRDSSGTVKRRRGRRPQLLEPLSAMAQKH